MEDNGTVRLIVDTAAGSSITELGTLADTAESTVRKAMTQVVRYVRSMAKSTAGALDKLSESVSDTFDQSVSGSVVYTVKRCLAGFDQINRLTARTTVSGTKRTAQTLEESQKTGTQLLETVVKPLTQYIQEKIPTALQTVIQKLSGISGTTDQAALSAAAYSNSWDLLNSRLGGWNTLMPVAFENMRLMSRESLQAQVQAELTARTILNLASGTGTLGSYMQLASGLIGQAAQQLVTSWAGSDNWFLSNVVSPLGSAFIQLWSGVQNGAGSAWSGVQSVFTGVGGFFRDTFQNAWQNVMGVFSDSGEVFQDLEGGVLSGFKQVTNELIDGINQVVTEPFQGINDALSKLKHISIGGLKPFLLLNWSIRMPRIPKLAKGAVLPANKPFMAVVGDQKHGTNVEAPLTTIQEAVALVMEDFHTANLAGHQATVAVLREILEAVLGIRIGDDVIASAVDRYRAKMAIVKGGV